MKHHARVIRLHKKSFCTLIKLKNITPNEGSMKRCIVNLDVETLSKLFKLESYEVVCQDLLKVGFEAQAKMVMEYLKDVLNILTFIIAVRRKSIELYLATQQTLLQKNFAIDHVNYCRNLIVQHINWEYL